MITYIQNNPTIENIKNKYKNYISNIEWDTKTNDRKGKAKEANDEQIKYYEEILEDLRSLQSQQPEISIEEHLKKGNTEFIGITFTADEKQPNNYLPTDDEVSNWFAENIDYECSASSAIYKFRLFLKELQSQQPKEAESDAVEFAEWMNKNMYLKYWGNEGENCDKWYKQYTTPDRKYYTGEELYKLFKNKQ